MAVRVRGGSRDAAGERRLGADGGAGGGGAPQHVALVHAAARAAAARGAPPGDTLGVVEHGIANGWDAVDRLALTANIGDTGRGARGMPTSEPASRAILCYNHPRADTLPGWGGTAMTSIRSATGPGCRRGITITGMFLITVLLSSCGGSTPISVPTAPTSSVATQIAPVATVVAPVQTQVATALAPAATRAATVVAPVQTEIATRAATVVDPLIETVQAQVGGVRPNPGACPSDHPIKGRTELLPPSRQYWLPGVAGYDQAMATICFANEADAQKALYRKAGA